MDCDYLGNTILFTQVVVKNIKKQFFIKQIRLYNLTEVDLREAKQEMVKWQNIRNENVIAIRDYLFTAEAIFANTDVVEEEEEQKENNDDLISMSSKQSNMSRMSRMSRGNSRMRRMGKNKDKGGETTDDDDVTSNSSKMSKMTGSKRNKGRMQR